MAPDAVVYVSEDRPAVVGRDAVPVVPNWNPSGPSSAPARTETGGSSYATALQTAVSDQC